MNQQCWCWGCDVRRAQGNLLLAFGFERIRPPVDVDGASRYRIAMSSKHELTLWGFGALISNDVNGVFLGRFQFEPKLCKPQFDTYTCWTPTDLPPRVRPTMAGDLILTGALCAQLFEFISEYESWVAEQVGIGYRQRTINEFKDATLAAREAKLQWRRLAKQAKRYYGRQAARHRIN